LNEDDLSEPKALGTWTRAEDYVLSLAHRRTARRAREAGPRTQPEAPRFLLSTLPFLLLIAAVALIAVVIIVAAWPGNRAPPRAAQPQEREVGTAPKGWFEEAKREFH